MLDWQMLIVAVLVAGAAWYVARATYRTWSGRRGGCGGGCHCASKPAAGNQQPNSSSLISTEQLTARLQTGQRRQSGE